MKLNTLFIITGILGLFFGLLTVLMPGPFYSFYGGELSDHGKNVAQLQGAAYLGYAILFFFATKAKDIVARRAIVIGFFVHAIIGLAVSIKWQLLGILNVWGWSTIVIFAFLSFFYLYFLIKGEE